MNTYRVSYSTIPDGDEYGYFMIEMDNANEAKAKAIRICQNSEVIFLEIRLVP